jgi:hypothetical protein
MNPDDEQLEWETVQDHYGEGRQRGGLLVLRNLRHPAGGSKQYRREMRRTGLMMAALVGLVVVGLSLLLSLL